MNLQHIASEIIKKKNNDLELRNKLLLAGELNDGYHPQMEQLHISNANYLQKIIHKIGFPTIEKVGLEAHEAAWLIIQHAISKPKFMIDCAGHLKKLVAQDQANPQRLAFLQDRIAVFQNRDQHYGTQFSWNKACELFPESYDDLCKVNQRRKSIGLNSLEDQIIIMNETAKKENQKAPADWKEQKRKFDLWRIQVGWIKK